MYDIKSATKTAIWLLCVGWYAWPVRYFFYYRFVSCGHSDIPGYDSCRGTTSSSGSSSGGGIGGVGVETPSMWGLNTPCSAAVDGFYSTNNIFYINMVGQGALLMLCCNIAYILTMLKAVNINNNTNNSGSAQDKNRKHKKNTTYSTGKCLSLSQYLIYNTYILSKL